MLSCNLPYSQEEPLIPDREAKKQKRRAGEDGVVGRLFQVCCFFDVFHFTCCGRKKTPRPPSLSVLHNLFPSRVPSQLHPPQNPLNEDNSPQNHGRLLRCTKGL